MKHLHIVALGLALVVSARSEPVVAAPTSLSVSIPLHFGGAHRRETVHRATAAEIRQERRLRLTRYGAQLVDAVISAIGYHAYAKCLSCLAYPGGGPRGGRDFMVADLNGGRPAEVDPLVAPFAHGGITSLALATLAYDAIDARIEHRWSIERRAAADMAEIGGHAWGVSTWLPEIRNLHRDAAIASACGAQWAARKYGEAFTDGCVNEYYRSAGGTLTAQPVSGVLTVCAPVRFAKGTYLFATRNDNIVASGSACTNVSSPFP